MNAYRQMITPQRERLLTIFVAGFFVLLLLPLSGAQTTPAQIDEFIVLSSARLIYDGALPYRDYFNFIPPLSHGLYAGLFALLGGLNAGAARALTDLIIVTTGLLSFSLLRRAGASAMLAGLPGLLLASLFFALWPIPLHHWLGLFFAVASLRVLWPVLNPGGQAPPGFVAKWGPAWLGGALLALTFLTVQTHGFIAFFSILAILLWAPCKSPEQQKTRWLQLLSLALGGVFVLLLFVLYLLLTHTLKSFFQESILFVFFQYSSGHNHNTMALLSDLGPRLEQLLNLSAPGWIIYSLILGTFASLGAVAFGLLWALLMIFRTLRRDLVSLLSWRRVMAIFLPWGAAYVALLGRPDVFHVAFYALLPLLMTSLALQAFRLPVSNQQSTKSQHQVEPSAAVDPDPQGVMIKLWIYVMSGFFMLGLWGHLLLPLVQGASVPAFFGSSQSSDPVLRDLPPVDAQLVADQPLIALLRGYGLQHPEARLFASINAIPAYFFAMPPAAPDTVVYAPNNSFSGPREYQRVVDHFKQRPPEFLLFMPATAAQRYLDSGPYANAPAQVWVDFVKAHYQRVISSPQGQIYQLKGSPPLSLGEAFIR